jgi:hypothetical protein
MECGEKNTSAILVYSKEYTFPVLIHDMNKHGHTHINYILEFARKLLKVNEGDDMHKKTVPEILYVTVNSTVYVRGVTGWNRTGMGFWFSAKLNADDAMSHTQRKTIFILQFITLFTLLLPCMSDELDLTS